MSEQELGVRDAGCHFHQQINPTNQPTKQPNARPGPGPCRTHQPRSPSAPSGSVAAETRMLFLRNASPALNVNSVLMRRICVVYGLTNIRGQHSKQGEVRIHI